MTRESVTKTVKLYNDTITIHFNNNARNRYVIEETGHSPVGCTTILQTLNKPALMTWPMFEAIEYLKKNPEQYEEASKAYLRKSQRGKDVGTDVHAVIEEYLNTGNITRTYLPDIDKPLKSFLEWWGETKPKVLGTEQIIYSKQFDYCGTYDALLEIDGKVVLADIKTTNASRTAPLGIYPEMFLQLGGYSLAHHEENPLEMIHDLMIVRVGKDGVLNTLRASELGFTPQFLEDAFKSVVNTYKFITPLSKLLTERKS